jgi:protease-4
MANHNSGIGFWKAFLATILGIFASLFLFFITLLVLGVSLGGNEVEVQDDSVLHLTLKTKINELTQKDPLSDLDLPTVSTEEAIGLMDLIKTLKNAKADERIKGIYLDLSYVQAGFVTLTELRNALLDFKESGKFIYSFADVMTEGAYFIASTADSVFLNPVGGIEMNGLATERMYYKQAFDKYGIKPEIFRVGEFKSAVEPYFTDHMSDEARFQTKTYLDSLNNFYLQEVAKSRKMSFSQIKLVSDSMLARMPEQALKYNLADRLVYRDQAEDAIRNALGFEMEEGKKKKKIKFIKLDEYMEAESVLEETDSKNRIAVIVGEGTIMDGEGGNGVVGGNRIATQIERARNDKNVKAIVLRINSPGGSALASDNMWREVVLTKGVKPIIASMGDVAASGGYYMAMACDTIVAMPNTITGSIGVFGVLFQAKKLLNEVGLTFDVVQTGAYSNLGSPSNEFSEGERSIIQSGVDKIYEDFTTKAANGRNMEVSEIKKIAGGRVWIGAEAKDIGLVDVLGDFQTALDIAANSAGLEEGDYRLKMYGAKKDDLLSKILGGATADLKKQAIREELGTLYPVYKQIQQLQKMQGNQLIMPWEVIIR